MTSSDSNQLNDISGIRIEEMRIAFLFFELAHKTRSQNLVFLIISFLSLAFSISLLIAVRFIMVSDATRIPLGILPVLPSLFGALLCSIWWFHAKRQYIVLEGIYTTVIDTYKTIDGKMPFLFEVERASQKGVTQSEFWNYVIALVFYLQMLVIGFGFWLSFLGP